MAGQRATRADELWRAPSSLQLGARRLTLVSRGSAVAVLTIAAVVFTGWALDLPILKGPIPGLVQMKANTAIGLAGLAMSLLLILGHPSVRKRRTARVLATVAVVIGGITIGEYVFGFEHGIDELLFADSGAVQTVHPGRLAPQTAIEFLCIGTALIAMSGHRVRSGLVDALVAIALVIALFPVIGYAYGAYELEALPSLTPMALHTGIASLLLCTGVGARNRDGFFVKALTGRSTGSITARRLLPWVLLLLPLVGWLRLQGETSDLYTPATGVALMVVVTAIILAGAVLFLARALNRVDEERRRLVAVERRLATLVAASGEAIMSADAEGIITSWNAAAEQLYGYTAEEIVGQPVTALHLTGGAADGQRLFKRGLTGERVATDVRGVHKDGSIVELAMTAAPIREGDRIVGACAIAHDISERLHAREMLETKVRERTADLARSRLETLERLARAAEFRDGDTAKHTQRVGALAAAVGRQLGLSEDYVTLLEQAAPLHDVGKIGIPDQILLKPGKLSREEFEAMKQHTVMGANLLSGSGSEILKLAEEIALTHHERWDGAGYPLGRAGPAIPIGGRIVAVVDSFDAMTHDRPYKVASPVGEALSEIRRCSGAQFDPLVVKAFLELAQPDDLYRKDRQAAAVGLALASSVNGVGSRRPVAPSGS